MRVVPSFAWGCGVALLAPLSLAAQTPRFVLELEGGPVWQSRNDVEIPNDGRSTRFSLRDFVGSGPWPAGRVYATWNVNERHGVRLLAAPLSFRETFVPLRPLRFASEGYAAGEPVKATYTFNSYRLSYRYRWHAADRTAAWVGFTGKLRDATVALQQEGTDRREEDVGFVPLLHVAGEWRMAPRWRLALDADGLAGGPGRAIDAALKLGFAPGGPLSLHVGYRTLEGGADVPEIYNFTWLHYAVASVAVRW